MFLEEGEGISKGMVSRKSKMSREIFRTEYKKSMSDL